MKALRLGNKVRCRQADLKREIRGGLPIAAALADPRAARMKVEVLTLALPGVGGPKVSRVLREVGVSPIRRVEDLTPRQRTSLVYHLGVVNRHGTLTAG